MILEYFVEECNYWIDLFGLRDWYWSFSYEELIEPSWGQYELDVQGRAVHVYLNRTVREEENWQEIVRASAQHEVTEAGLLGTLKIMAEEKYATREQVETEVHRIVHLLDNCYRLLYPELRDTTGFPQASELGCWIQKIEEDTND